MMLLRVQRQGISAFVQGRHTLRNCGERIAKIAQDEFVPARLRREACCGTLTDDNAAVANSDKQDMSLISRRFLTFCQSICSIRLILMVLVRKWGDEVQAVLQSQKNRGDGIPDGIETVDNGNVEQ